MHKLKYATTLPCVTFQQPWLHIRTEQVPVTPTSSQRLHPTNFIPPTTPRPLWAAGGRATTDMARSWQMLPPALYSSHNRVPFLASRLHRAINRSGTFPIPLFSSIRECSAPQPSALFLLLTRAAGALVIKTSVFFFRRSLRTLTVMTTSQRASPNGHHSKNLGRAT